MNPQPRLAVFGGGRMGRQVAERAESAGFHLLGLVTRQSNGGDWTEVRQLGDLAETPDVVIDFSLPGGTAIAADWCAEHRVPLVSGTTGLSEDDEAALERASAHTAVLWSSNFGLGINVLLAWLSQAADWLPGGREAHILDIHHVHKQDAPSGTALSLGEALGGAIEYDSVREGEVIGEHRVRLKWQGESLELVHRAEDRGLFASGALRAARWVLGRPNGRYGNLDWLTGSSAV